MLVRISLQFHWYIEKRIAMVVMISRVCLQ